MPDDDVARPEKICFETHCFSLEFANTPETRRQGLMHRDSLDQNTGMLFIFPTPKKARFWMKDTKMPLDIIWLSTQLKVIHIKHNATPFSTESLIPPEKAKYVLEINGGIANKLGIQRGDQLEFK